MSDIEVNEHDTHGLDAYGYLWAAWANMDPPGTTNRAAAPPVPAGEQVCVFTKTPMPHA